jgi:hypothetical protein
VLFPKENIVLRSAWVGEERPSDAPEKQSWLSVIAVLTIFLITQIAMIAGWLYVGASIPVAIGLTVFMDIAGIIYMHR